MSTNGTLMYRVKPLYDFCSEISLPTCMYKMDNNYGKERVMNCPRPEVSGDVDLLPIEKSQLSIIQKLEDLKARVIELKKEFGTVNEIFEERLDIVIKASPYNPPLSVWMLQPLLSARLRVYRHSSLTDDDPWPDTLRECEGGPLSIAVVWRDGGLDPEMMVSPIRQTAIEGEVNIARYLWRLLGAEDPPQADDWLELTHRAVVHGNRRDRKEAWRAMVDRLRDHPFLAGAERSAADVAAASALIQTGMIDFDAPQHIARWAVGLSPLLC